MSCGTKKEGFMKNIFIGIFALLLVLAFALEAQQFCPESDFKARPIDGDAGIEIPGYMGANEHIRIPPLISGVSVTRIGDRAFYDSNLISVTIPNSVTSIEEGAFAVNLLTSVTSIGVDAFWMNNLFPRINELSCRYRF